MKAATAIGLGLAFLVAAGAIWMMKPKSLRQQFKDVGCPLVRATSTMGFSEYQYGIPGATRSQAEDVLAKAGFKSDLAESSTEYHATKETKQTSVFYYRGNQIVLLTTTPDLEISTYPELN